MRHTACATYLECHFARALAPALPVGRMSAYPSGFALRGRTAGEQPQIRSYPVTMPLAEARASWAARARRRARNP